MGPHGRAARARRPRGRRLPIQRRLEPGFLMRGRSVRKAAFAALWAFAASATRAASAEQDAGGPRATMACEHVATPGRVRCEVEARVGPGESIAWATSSLCRCRHSLPPCAVASDLTTRRYAKRASGDGPSRSSRATREAGSSRDGCAWSCAKTRRARRARSPWRAGSRWDRRRAGSGVFRPRRGPGFW
jgi:uncharacterized membrane protein